MNKSNHKVRQVKLGRYAVLKQFL